MSSCKEIGEPSLFGNEARYPELSNRAPEGIAGKVDSCDIRTAFRGAQIFTDEAIVMLFQEKSGKLLPQPALRRRIDFLAEFPNSRTFVPQFKRVAQAHLSGANAATLRTVVSNAFDEIFDTFTRLRQKHQIPLENSTVLQEIETIFLSKLLAGALRIPALEVANEISNWACRSSHFAEPLLSIWGLFLARTGIQVHATGTGIDPDTGAVHPQSAFGECYNDPTVSPARRKILDTAKDTALREARKKPQPPAKKQPGSI